MSKFIERHKRKSLLAALLLIFRGRGKYIALSLVIVALSVPFVVSEGMMSKFIDLPAVKSILKLTGFGSVLSSINPYYSRQVVKSALEQIAEESDRYSVWQKFLQGLAGSIGGDAKGTVAMVRVGEGFYDDERQKKGGIKGVLSEEEKAKGESADAVNFADLANMDPTKMVGGIGGFGQESGLGYGAFINRSFVSKGGAVGSKSEGMMASVMNMPNVPEPNAKGKGGKYRKDNKMGRVSGFSWKNVGHQVKGKPMDVRIATHKKALFQMAETFTMTAAAYKMKKGYEYQAAYTGATYDGNDVNVDVIATDAAPEMPDTVFTGDLMNSAGALAQLAKDCGDSQASDGQAITELSNEMKAIREGMGSPPKCCNHGAVKKWNNNVKMMRNLCKQINTHAANLAQKCQSEAKEQADCSGTIENAKEINPCSKLKCWLGIILAAILIIAGVLLIAFGGAGLLAIGIGLAISGGLLLLGQLIGGTLGAMLSLIGGVIAAFFSGPAALAIIFSSLITSQVMQWLGPEDGSSVINNN